MNTCLIIFRKLSVSRACCLLVSVTRSIRAKKMASQTQGIQQLLAAEKRAAEKVAEARRRKTKRLKQAKEEAQEEIEKYRLEREKQFKDFETKHMGSREDVAARIEVDCKVKIDEMNKAITHTKDSVIKHILELVYDIKPELHKNFKVQAQ